MHPHQTYRLGRDRQLRLQQEARKLAKEGRRRNRRRFIWKERTDAATRALVRARGRSPV
jgi:hypothetical protein